MEVEAPTHLIAFALLVLALDIPHVRVLEREVPSKSACSGFVGRVEVGFVLLPRIIPESVQCVSEEDI